MYSTLLLIGTTNTWWPWVTDATYDRQQGRGRYSTK